MRSELRQHAKMSEPMPRGHVHRAAPAAAAATAVALHHRDGCEHRLRAQERVRHRRGPLQQRRPAATPCERAVSAPPAAFPHVFPHAFALAFSKSDPHAFALHSRRTRRTSRHTSSPPTLQPTHPPWRPAPVGPSPILPGPGRRRRAGCGEGWPRPGRLRRGRVPWRPSSARTVRLQQQRMLLLWVRVRLLLLRRRRRRPELLKLMVLRLQHLSSQFRHKYAEAPSTSTLQRLLE